MAEGTGKKIYFAQETIPSLPLEVVAEILSWLPVQYLIVSKSVCREWRLMIDEPSFIKKHASRGSTVILFGNHEDVDVNEIHFKVICASEGLVLQERDKLHYRIKNPATRQVLHLPPVKEPGHMFFNYVFGRMVYKLVHLHAEGLESGDLCCEVLTVADDLIWRGLNSPTLKNFYGDNARICLGANSDVIYILKIDTTGLADTKIIFLDLVTECFSCFEIPRNFFWDWNNVYPMIWKEKLSLTSVVEDKLIVWVLESYKLNQWADREIVIPLTFAKDLFAAEDKVYAAVLSGSLLYLDVNDHVSIAYDIEEKKVKNIIPIPVEPDLWFEVHPSLVQLKGMQAEERVEG